MPDFIGSKEINEALVQAIRQGDEKRVDEIFKTHGGPIALLSVGDKEYIDVIKYTVSVGQMSMLDKFIKTNFGIFILQTEEQTFQIALQEAINNQHMPIIDHIITKYVDKLNVYRTRAGKGSVAGATVVLQEAVKNGKINLFEKIVKQYPDTADIGATDHRGYNLLHLAANNGHIEMFDYLLSNYPDTFNFRQRTEDDSKNTVFFLSIDGTKKKVNIDFLNHLLSKYPDRINLFEKNENGFTALRLTETDEETTMLLLEKGALLDEAVQPFYENPRKVIEAARSLFEEARFISKGNLKMYQNFLEKRCGILKNALNARREPNQNTALHEAVLHKNIPFIGWVIQKGADVNVRNAKEYSPLDLAKQSNDPDLIRVMNYAQHFSTSQALLQQILDLSAEKSKLEAQRQAEMKDIKDVKESKETAALEATISKLKADAQLSITFLDKFAFTGEKGHAESEVIEALNFELGKMLADPLSPIFMPNFSRKLLNSVTEGNKENFKETQKLIRTILLQPEPQEADLKPQVKGLEPEPLDLEVQSDRGAGEKDKERYKARELLIPLLNSIEDEGDLTLVEKNLVGYAAGAEYSVVGLGKGKPKSLGDVVVGVFDLVNEQRAKEQRELAEAREEIARLKRELALSRGQSAQAVSPAPAPMPHPGSAVNPAPPTPSMVSAKDKAETTKKPPLVTPSFAAQGRRSTEHPSGGKPFESKPGVKPRDTGKGPEKP